MTVFQLFFHNKRARTVEEALIQVTSRKIVKRVLKAGCRPALLERVAQEIDCSEEHLLRACADILGLGFIAELHVPTSELVEKTGYDAKTLKRAGIFPQRHLRGYVLAVAD